MSSTSAGFHAETTCRRENGFSRRERITWAIWSM